MAIQIKLTHRAEKQITKAPKVIQDAVSEWIRSVYEIGLEATRVQGGRSLHDEPLKGKLNGIRTIRLNRSWRLYYSIEKGHLTVVLILRVDKHRY